MAIDPICKMTVDEKTAKFTSIYNGKIIDSDGNLWYLVEKEPGNRLWIAAWLTLPA